MTLISVLEIQYDLIDHIMEQRFKEISKFFEIFNNKALIILVESFISDAFLSTIIDKEKVYIEKYQLNSFAKNRLINNFIKDRPELSFIFMGCSSESTLIKIWRQNDKRKGI